METSLHRQLKALYADESTHREVTLDGYRIDAIVEGRLIEIQYGSLGAIRDKVRTLLDAHDVLVVKPLVSRRYLVKRKRKRGKVVSARYSPLRQTFLHLFDDLVHFVGVFGHERLAVEVLLCEQEEHRLPAKKRRFRSKGYRVEDRLLRQVDDRLMLRTPEDLAELLPRDLPESFTTGDIAQRADIPRWLAQKMAYCLRKTGVAEAVDKQGNAIVYRCCKRKRAA